VISLRGGIAATVWYVAVLLSIRFGQVQPDPVPAIQLNAPAVDASVPPPPPPPEPAGDCGEWDDSEECET
jgi:hypothetical protein